MKTMAKVGSFVMGTSQPANLTVKIQKMTTNNDHEISEHVWAYGGGIQLARSTVGCCPDSLPGGICSTGCWYTASSRGIRLQEGAGHYPADIKPESGSVHEMASGDVWAGLPSPPDWATGPSAMYCMWWLRPAVQTVQQIVAAVVVEHYTSVSLFKPRIGCFVINYPLWKNYYTYGGIYLHQGWTLLDPQGLEAKERERVACSLGWEAYVTSRKTSAERTPHCSESRTLHIRLLWSLKAGPPHPTVSPADILVISNRNACIWTIPLLKCGMHVRLCAPWGCFMVPLCLGGQEALALVDTGCGRTLVKKAKKGPGSRKHGGIHEYCTK